MSTNELSDAELAIELRGFYSLRPEKHFLIEAADRLDELRKVVEQVKELAEDIRPVNGYVAHRIDEALAPTQKEACKKCGQFEGGEPIAATAYTPHSWTCDCHHCLCFTDKGPPTKPADARHQIEANMANKLYIRSIGWGETTSKSIAKIIMDAIVQYAASAQGKP